jgi:hypothetical protein
VGGTHGTETYILIANVSDRAGTANVTLHFEDGTTATKAIALPPLSRVNVQLSIDFPQAAGKMFAASSSRRAAIRPTSWSSARCTATRTAPPGAAAPTRSRRASSNRQAPSTSNGGGSHLGLAAVGVSGRHPIR